MHTLKIEEHATYVHHNGDFSGNVLIHFQVAKDKLDTVPTGGPWESEKGDVAIEGAPWGWQLSIPMGVLEVIVARKICNEAISRLEQMSVQEVLDMVRR